jgi:hypothetical protein
LHHVKRSGKKKIWIPLERKTWVESKELEGEVKRGLGRSFCFQSWAFSLVESSSLHGEKVEWKRERRWWVCGFGEGEGWWIREEREERGVKRRIFLLLGPRVEVGRHRSDRWLPMVEPVSPYRFFRPTLGRTDDLEKFNREAISVESTYPR